MSFEHIKSEIFDSKKHGKIHAALDVAVALIKDHLGCKKEGRSLCGECKVSATKFLSTLDKMDIDIHPLKTMSKHHE